jgi:hypothetical protein
VLAQVAAEYTFAVGAAGGSDGDAYVAGQQPDLVGEGPAPVLHHAPDDVSCVSAGSAFGPVRPGGR